MSSSVSGIPLPVLPAGSRGRTPVVTYTLSEHEAVRARKLAQDCLTVYGSAGTAEFQRDVPVIAAGLPAGLRAAVNAARLDDRLHALVIRGNPLDEDALEGTPTHWRDADTPGSRVHAVLLALYAALLGDAIGWATQQDGKVITDVLPIPGFEDSLVSSCSEQELGWHTEDAFSTSRADYVGLYCLRSPERIPTTLAGVDLEAMPVRVADVLAQPRFLMLPTRCAGSSGTWTAGSTWSSSPATPGSSTTAMRCTAGVPSAPATTAATAGSSGSTSWATCGEPARTGLTAPPA
ncbi:Fe(II)-2OG oxygenase family protein [Streptomyces rubiginosohelvolus]|uniref:hypothetical protein n=1 Tax=Streptomyces rubiginosohelvolus TaxID=67362 RepID=UPI0036B33DFF